jgi:hypothetical protein
MEVIFIDQIGKLFVLNIEKVSDEVFVKLFSGEVPIPKVEAELYEHKGIYGAEDSYIIIGEQAIPIYHFVKKTSAKSGK